MYFQKKFFSDLFLLNVHLIFRTVPFFSQEPGSEVMKLFSCSTQQEISLGYKNKNTNNKNFFDAQLSWVEHERSFKELPVFKKF